MVTFHKVIQTEITTIMLACHGSHLPDNPLMRGNALMEVTKIIGVLRFKAAITFTKAMLVLIRMIKMSTTQMVNTSKFMLTEEGGNMETTFIQTNGITNDIT
mmetsp:Transcript_24445/g.41860  ORF Transcript_24445/g.41860 Transcript_24445/m.41860 type:complete len:102 (+) Transcript_24445:2520-2825(+)